MRYTFSAKLWVWSGNGASWHFVSVPKKESEIIKSKIKVRRGFGSVKVTVTIGETTWDTSVFPDGKSQTYILPIKATVRRKEDVEAGDVVCVNLKTL